MKNNKILGILLVSSMLLATSCSDIIPKKLTGTKTTSTAASSKFNQLNAQSVAETYIRAFHSGDIATLKKIVNPKELAQLREEELDNVMFTYIKQNAKAVTGRGGYKNIVLDKPFPASYKNSVSFYYSITLPFPTRYGGAEWRVVDDYSVSLTKDANGKWWVDSLEGIYLNTY